MSIIPVFLTEWACEVGARMAVGLSPGIILVNFLVGALTLAIAQARDRWRPGIATAERLAPGSHRPSRNRRAPTKALRVRRRGVRGIPGVGFERCPGK